MTDEKKGPTTEAENKDPANQGSKPREAQDVSSDEVEVQPTLVGYFGETRASAATFFKVLRTNDVKRFRSGDQEAAAKLMLTKDPEGERLWGLMSQSSMPESVDAWIWGAAQSRIKEQLGEAFDPQDYDAKRIFKSVLKELAAGLRADQKEEKKRAETLLRLAICWLVEKRSLKTWQIAEQLRPVLFPDLTIATKVAQRAVQKGRTGELRLATAMAGLGDEMVKAAEAERIRERSIATDLRLRLDDAQQKVETLNFDLEHARSTIADHEATVEKLKQTLAAERQHWAHDLTEIKAEHKVLLRERLGPLLDNAVEALEMDPPALKTALSRVKSALTEIEEAQNE